MPDNPRLSRHAQQLGLEFAPQDLARVGLWNRFDEEQATPEPLVRRHLRVEELDDVAITNRVVAGFFDDVGTRQFAGYLVRNADHRHVQHGRMAAQQVFQFRRSHLRGNKRTSRVRRRCQGSRRSDRSATTRLYLQALDFDELLQPVDDVELIIFVVDSDVSSVEPTVRVDGGLGGLDVVVVALHQLRTNDAQLAFLAGSERFTRVEIDDLGPSARNGFAARADLVVEYGTHVRDRRRLRHAKACIANAHNVKKAALCPHQDKMRRTLLEEQIVFVQSLDQTRGGGLAERRGAAKHGVQTVESFQFHVRVVAKERDQWRHQLQHGRLRANRTKLLDGSSRRHQWTPLTHVVVPDGVKERFRFEAGQRHQLGSVVQTAQHHRHHSVDVEEGQDARVHLLERFGGDATLASSRV